MKKREYKIKNITPNEHKCIIGACPTIVESNNGSYIIVGELMNNNDLSDLGLLKKVGENEVAIEIPKSLLRYINTKDL